MSTYLKTVEGSDVAVYQNMTRNIAAGQVDVGSGGGAAGQFIRVDKHTGAVTYGRDALPLPPDHRFVLGLHNILHGYVTWSSTQKQPLDRHLVSMAKTPTPPAPPGGRFVGFGDDGPRKCIELIFDSVDEPGFVVSFSSMSVSNDNRIRRCLLEPIGANDGTERQRAGFVHPVVTIGSDSYKHPTYGVIHTISFDIVDWLHVDRSTLLSKRDDAASATNGPTPAAEPASWDDDPTEDELDLLKA